MTEPHESSLERLTALVDELSRKQQDLEQRLARLEQKAPMSVQQPVVPSIAAAPSPGKVEPAPAKVNPVFESKLGLTLVNRIGVITLVIGVTFFFKWAADNNWIGPIGRVLLGLFAGFSALVLAEYLWRRAQQTFALGVTGTGIAISYVSLYAAFSFYQLIPLSLVFALMFAVTVLAYVLSLRYASPVIASLGLFGAYLTPLLLRGPEDRPWFLYFYLLLLNTAAVALARLRKWRIVEWLALFSTTLIYGIWLASEPTSHTPTLVATLPPLTYYALFAVSESPLLAVAANTFAAIGIATVWQKSAMGFFSIEIALTGAGMGYATVRRYPGAAIAGLTSFWFVYGIFQFDAYTAVCPDLQFFGISAAFVVFFLWRYFQADGVDAESASLWMLSVNGLIYFAFSYALLHVRDLGWLGLVALGVSVSYFLSSRRSPVVSRPALLDYLGGHVMLLAALSLELLFWTIHHITPGNRWSVQTASLSIVLALYAVAVIGLGMKSGRAVDRFFGLVLIGLVLVKLYFYDVWQLGHIYRIAAFVVLGLLLLSTSFLYSRFRNVIEALWKTGSVGN